jgi:hypothetical protein
MKVNFEIIHLIELQSGGRVFDIHNNFSCTGFEYDIKERVFRISWKKSDGNWVPADEVAGLTLIHKAVGYFMITDKEENSAYSDDSCIGEMSFFPSTHRDMNESIIDKPRPDAGDDILYFFENGQLIRIGCKEIELVIDHTTTPC